MKWRPKAKNSIINEKERVNNKGPKSDVLKIFLEHGDIMVMHGRRIQELYEVSGCILLHPGLTFTDIPKHKVQPHGKLRFALTSRYIVPATIQDESERRYAEEAGQLPRHSATFEYDGIMDADFKVHTPPGTEQSNDKKWSTYGTHASEELHENDVSEVEGLPSTNTSTQVGTMQIGLEQRDDEGEKWSTVRAVVSKGLYENGFSEHQGLQTTSSSKQAGRKHTSLAEREFYSSEAASSFSTQAAPTVARRESEQHSLDNECYKQAPASFTPANDPYEYLNIDPTLISSLQPAVLFQQPNEQLEYHNTNPALPSFSQHSATPQFHGEYLGSRNEYLPHHREYIPSHGDFREYSSIYAAAMTQPTSSLYPEPHYQQSYGYNYTPIMTAPVQNRDSSWNGRVERQEWTGSFGQ